MRGGDLPSVAARGVPPAHGFDDQAPRLRREPSRLERSGHLRPGMVPLRIRLPLLFPPFRRAARALSDDRPRLASMGMETLATRPHLPMERGAENLEHDGGGGHRG